MLFRSEYLGKTRTVDMHIKSLRAKLSEPARDPRYIITVHGLGYKVSDQEYDE